MKVRNIYFSEVQRYIFIVKQNNNKAFNEKFDTFLSFSALLCYVFT